MMDLAHFEAARSGNVNDFPFCAINKSGESVVLDIFNKVSPSGNTLLHVAASAGQEEITKLMVCNFRNLIPLKNSEGDTALHVAARAGKLKTVKILVDCAKEPDLIDRCLLKMRNDKGNTALHEALLAMDEDKASKESVDLVALAHCLILADPKVCYCRNKSDKSPLCMAVASGNIDILKYLLSALPNDEDLDIMVKDKSPVHLAIRETNLGVIELIKEEKQQLLLLRDDEGNTPLHCAASIGFLEGVCYLLEIKNNNWVFERNKEGLYPVHLACRNGHVEVMKMLLHKWSDPTEMLSTNGRNILHVAAESGKQNVVGCILKEIKTDKLINDMDKDGNTPLHLAALCGHSLVVGMLLLDRQSKSYLINNEGLTAFGIARRQYEKLGDQNVAGKNKNKVVDMTEHRKNPGKTAVNSKDQNVSETNKAVDVTQSWKDPGNVEKQSTKVDSMAPKEGSLFQTMMTLSILFVVHKFMSARSSKGNKRITEDLKFRTCKPLKQADVNTRVNYLLVVATLIVGMAFGGSVQLPSSGDKDQHHNNSTNIISNPDQNLTSSTEKFTLQLFIVADSLAMNFSITAAVMLCCAQLVDMSLASIIVRFAFVMVVFSLVLLSYSYMAAIYIRMMSDTKFVMVVFGTHTMLLFAMLLSATYAFYMKEAINPYLYFLFFCLYFGLKRLCSICSRRKQKKK